MKSKKHYLEQLNTLSYFDKNTVRQIGAQLGLKNIFMSEQIITILKKGNDIR